MKVESCVCLLLVMIVTGCVESSSQKSRTEKASVSLQTSSAAPPHSSPSIQRKTIAKERAAVIAEHARKRLGGSDCGGVSFESETSTEWRFRWQEGFAGKDEGVIVVDKVTGTYRRELPVRVF